MFCLPFALNIYTWLLVFATICRSHLIGYDSLRT